MKDLKFLNYLIYSVRVERIPWNKVNYNVIWSGSYDAEVGRQSDKLQKKNIWAEPENLDGSNVKFWMVKTQIWYNSLWRQAAWKALLMLLEIKML